MASKYASYTRLRDIAVKRAGRLEKAGLSTGISFPTVKQIKSEGLNLTEATSRLQMFLEAPTKTSEYRKLPDQERLVFLGDKTGPVVTTEAGRSEAEKYIKKERERELHRQRNRRYRERLRNLTKREKSDLKASRTLGYSVGPSQAQMFSEYLAYRFKFGDEKKPYAIATYTEEFHALMKKNKYHSFDDMQKDFEGYMMNRHRMEDEYDNMNGISGAAFESMWSQFSGIFDSDIYDEESEDDFD